MINYSFEIFEYDEALSPYGTIETHRPDESSFAVDDFRDGKHFRTKADSDNALTLSLENRILTFLLDRSGSMTWNDNKGDRYTYLLRLLQKLQSTYPEDINVNLIGFGGVLTKTKLFVAKSSNSESVSQQTFQVSLQQAFQDSIYDFAGTRVVRRTDRFPIHPADGVIVAEGIIDAAKDENLTIGQTYYYGVWTFNRNRLFSEGQFIKTTMATKIIPKGVNFASVISRILPGVKRDQYTELIYNFTERSGFVVFDSSGSGRHGVIGEQVVEDSFWSGDASTQTYDANGDTKQSTGVRFDGTFDIIQTTLNDSSINYTSNGNLSINLWIFAYQQSNTAFVTGVSSDAPSDQVNWSILLSSSREVLLSFNNLVSGTTISTNVFVPERQWTMISVVFNGSTVQIYKNGNLSGSLPSPVSVLPFGDTLYIGARVQDDTTLWSGADFFGCLNQISIHSTARDSAYISSLFSVESQIFSQSISNTNQSPLDNSQRESLIVWEVGSDFDYAGGTVKILRKYRSIPSHADDGDVVVERAAESGQFFFLDTFDFIDNSDYYYRVFTINAYGNACDRNDARILPVHIQKYVLTETLSPLNTTSNETATEGDKKVLLQWTNPTDADWRGTRIYVGNGAFPTVSLSSQGSIQVTNGFEISDTTKTYYVHRSMGKNSSGTDISLTNGLTYYYTFVTYDRLNRISAARNIRAVPTSQTDNAFTPYDVNDLHIIPVTSESVSVQWQNPTLQSNDIELYFNESALVFVSVKDIFGGDVTDVTNLNLQVCTTFKERKLRTTEEELQNNNTTTVNPGGCPGAVSQASLGDCKFGVKFQKNCNTPEQQNETSLTYVTVESGLIKGILTHTSNRQILARREQYIMDVRAQYVVEDSETSQSLFEFNSNSARIKFTHPIKMSLVNLLNKKIEIGCDQNGGIRGDRACACPEDQDECNPKTFNGGYIGATQPYVCRVEVQYKGEALPNGTVVNVFLFKHGNKTSPNPLSEKSTRTAIREGAYSTTAVQSEERDGDGNPTGRFVSKSIVDVEVLHPSLPDYVDLYVTINFNGLFVDAVQEIRFIGSLFIAVDVAKPAENGIEAAEQFANVYTIHPDYPNDISKRLPVPDGTIVKWELVKLQFAKDRPFYSTERISQAVSGIYSSTRSGVARSVFFGPVGNIQNHTVFLTCTDTSDSTDCCVGEEYAIKASVIYNETSASDTVAFNYGCQNTQFANRRFLMNADNDQEFAGGTPNAPHWVTWADGIHMLRFQIAKNPSTTDLLGAECFRNCLETVSGQLLPLPEEHIVQVTAPGEILWNVVFDEDPYTGLRTPKTYDSISPKIASDLGIPLVANIPIKGDITEFYLRLNAFVDSQNPRPEDCEQSGEGSNGGNSDGVAPCEWRNMCVDVIPCQPVSGPKWVNVSPVTGRTSLIINNKEVTLMAGGEYADGLPPIYAGFREPLDVIILDARVNGERVDELVVDGLSRHTFTVEILFAGEPVPDGTPVYLSVSGQDQSVVILLADTAYTRQVNDPIVNPQDNTGTVSARSICYFSIEPLPNTKFYAKINVSCKYDKLGTIQRNITRCIEVSNTVNSTPPSTVPVDKPIITSASSNETIIYNTITDFYSTTRSGRIRRIGHFSAAITNGSHGDIFVFGGYTGSGDSSTKNITPTSEAFSVASQEWGFIPDMPTARAYGMSVVHENKIYCIGGIELNVLASQYVVSQMVEVFDTISGLWETKSSMPDDYGVAYGDAQVVGDYIYILCGLNSIDNNSIPGRLNDKILRYSITNNEWDTITVSDDFLYQRVSPFGFYRSLPSDGTDYRYYIYGGSIPKSRDTVEAERNLRINKALGDLRSFLMTSDYYGNLTTEEQETFILSKETEIRNGITVPAFIYPQTGFRFLPGSEIETADGLFLDISDTIDRYWNVLPKPRSHGSCIYIPEQDVAYFIGGSNQNQSTTLNRNESIDLLDGNQYARLSPLGRGRAMFGAVLINSDIYITGGLTSGHREGYVQIDVQQVPDYVAARGTQSCGILVSLRNDSGELIEDSVRVIVRGRLRISALDSVLANFYAKRAVDRILGSGAVVTTSTTESGTSGGSSGAATGADSTSGTSDTSTSTVTTTTEDGQTTTTELSADDIRRIIQSQNSIVDPNSDEFQFNAARKLGDEVFLFPILYSQTEFVVTSGIGGTTLLPRSEDPLTDFEKISQFIQDSLNNTPNIDSEERNRLAALGETLSAVQLPPTIIDAGAVRSLYDIETVVTVLDDFYFGQTVSDIDTDIQENVQSIINELIKPPTPNNPPSLPGLGLGGNSSPSSECFILQHSSKPDIPAASTPPSTVPNVVGSGGFSQSGQCLFCQSVLPLTVDIRQQSPSIITKYFNSIDWLPQIQRELVNNSASIADCISALETIKDEIPFGSSQLFSALFEAARVMTADEDDTTKKCIYVASDNSQNLSLVSRDSAIDEVNSIQGDKQSPVIYAVFSTSFPVSLSALIERSSAGDATKIAEATGGQSVTLIASSFIDEILNLSISGATGGLGYGIYSNIIDFGQKSAITSAMVTFDLPSNTHGFFRYRYSDDGFNFSNYTQRYQGTQNIDFSDFFARYVEIEVVLTTGFTEEIDQASDTVATGLPKLVSIVWSISAEREDFIFLNPESAGHSVQQIAMAVDADIPENAIIECGVATSNSHNWMDFQSSAQPSVIESGKVFVIDREDKTDSVVPSDFLTTVDGKTYVSQQYGPWNPNSSVSLFSVDDKGVETPILSGYREYPRKGQIYFDSRQPLDKRIKISILNADIVKVGVRIRNRLHTESVTLRGTGYLYNTNTDKLPALSQVPPKAVNVMISPQSPTAGDTFVVLYKYVDLNGNPESDSIISWFKNGRQLFEIQNKKTWVNTDLMLGNRLTPTDKLYVSVQPGDGRDLGIAVYSPTVVISPRPPGLSGLKIVAFRNGLINNRYDTSSTLTLQYQFVTDDSGQAAVEDGTLIQWFVNGQLFKETTFSSTSQDPYVDPKSLTFSETSGGTSAFVIGNQIYAEITPKTALITGSTTRTASIVIENSVPIVTNAVISPSTPAVQSTLQVTYSIQDRDIELANQTDQSSISWFSSTNGNDFVEVTSLRNSKIVAPVNLRAGQKWYAQIVPNDGLDVSSAVQTNTVTILA